MNRANSAPPARREPSEDELLAMAYADGELSGEARLALEARLAAEPNLGRAVAEQEGLVALARRLAPPEPMDHEWRRLAGHWPQRAGVPLGLGLALGGAVLLGAASVAWISTSALPMLVKIGALAVIAGLALLLALALHARLRTLPYDPYTKIER
jgi:anti-sigma factor RsiW